MNINNVSTVCHDGLKSSESIGEATLIARTLSRHCSCAPGWLEKAYFAPQALFFVALVISFASALLSAYPWTRSPPLDARITQGEKTGDCDSGGFERLRGDVDEADRRDEVAVFLAIELALVLIILVSYLANDWPSGDVICRATYVAAAPLYKPLVIPLWSCLMTSYQYGVAVSRSNAANEVRNRLLASRSCVGIAR